LKAPRSPNLTLSIEKIKRSLGLPIPDQPSGLQKFHQLFEDGFPEKLKSYLAAKNMDDVRGDE